MKLTFLSLKMMVKSGLEFILKLTEPLQSCCCPVQKNLPSRAELAWQVSRYLWRGSVNFKINSRPLFTIIFKAKNVNFKTRDFSPLIEWVLAGVDKQPTEGGGGTTQKKNWVHWNLFFKLLLDKFQIMAGFFYKQWFLSSQAL